MDRNQFTRRDWMRGAGTSLAALTLPFGKTFQPLDQSQSPVQQDSAEVLADRALPMDIPHEAC